MQRQDELGKGNNKAPFSQSDLALVPPGSGMLEVDPLLLQSLTDFIDVVSLARILGHRVAELEKKLKTLEVSGLWSLQGEHPPTVSLTCMSRCFNQVIPKI